MLLLQALRWHDNRDGDLFFVTDERCWALILNVRSNGWLAVLMGGRHWLGIRRFGDTWSALAKSGTSFHLFVCHV